MHIYKYIYILSIIFHKIFLFVNTNSDQAVAEWTKKLSLFIFSNIDLCPKHILKSKCTNTFFGFYRRYSKNRIILKIACFTHMVNTVPNKIIDVESLLISGTPRHKKIKSAFQF
jgi:hypothetical protein